MRPFQMNKRIGNIVPLNVVRITVDDTQIEKYSIPKERECVLESNWHGWSCSCFSPLCCSASLSLHQRVWSPTWILNWGPLTVPNHMNCVQCQAKTSKTQMC